MTVILKYEQCVSFHLFTLQSKEVGEPQQKKGKCLLGADADDDNEEVVPNEEPEDVISHH